MRVRLSPEVADAVGSGRGVVALESTLLAHGLPAPRNREVAARLEEVVRAHGAVPATVAVLDGIAVVGLTSVELDRICDPARQVDKLSHRDLAVAAARGGDGATTVASTSTLAHAAGVRVFATGGIGGVHRGAAETYDVSADLDVLAQTPIVVVCAGVKSILDVTATLEVLESRSIPVLGYQTSRFPAFYRRDSGHDLTWRVETGAEVAAIVEMHWGGVGPSSAVVVANPVPAEAELDQAVHDAVLEAGLARVAADGIRGKDVTPALLAYFHEHTDGRSLRANEALVLANAAVAAQVAVALAPDQP